MPGIQRPCLRQPKILNGKQTAVPSNSGLFFCPKQIPICPNSGPHSPKKETIPELISSWALLLMYTFSGGDVSS